MENSKKLLELKKREERLEITVEDLKKDLIEYEGRLREVKEEIEKEMKKGNSKKRKRSEEGVEGKENKRKKQNKKFEEKSKERPFVKELTIRKEVYKEITKFLPKKEGENIRKKTQKSEKLWKTIEEIGGKEEIKKLEEFSMNEIINWKEGEINLIRKKIFFGKEENEESETE